MIVKINVTGLQQGQVYKHGFHIHATGIKNDTDDISASKIFETNSRGFKCQS